jgi:hypothetical protein
VAIVSSGGGDPPCTSSVGVSCGAIAVCVAPPFRGGLRLAAFERRAGDCRFAPVRRLGLVPRLVAVRRLAVVRRFVVVRRLAVVRRFACVRFFRDDREVAARFLRFAICRLSDRTLLYHFLGKKERRGGHGRA